MIIHHVNLGNHFKSPVQFFFRPSPRVETFFLEVFATLAHKCSKTHGKKVSPHVTCPASPQTLSMGRFFCFHEVFATLAQKCPKPMEKQKTKKQKKYTMSPVQLLFRPSPWVDFFDFCFLLRWCSGWPLGLFCRVTYQVTNG